MKSEIKALIFDVGGVLRLGNPSFEHPRVHNFVAAKLNTNLDQYFDSIDTVYAKSIEGKLSEEKTLSLMAKNLKTTPSKLKKIYLSAYKKYYVLNEVLLTYASQLKKSGYKIAILSDQWWLSKEALIPKGFYKKFDLVIISTDVRLRKPNPKIYSLTLKKLKCSPKESIFIDNQKWNITPARKLGMKTVLFRNTKQAIEEIETLLK